MSDVEESTPSSSSVQNDELKVVIKEECNSPLPEKDTTSETNDETEVDKGPKEESQEGKHFAAMEGELLDFEDFNEKIMDMDKTINTKDHESEDGQCGTPEKNASEKKDDSVEEGEDEGVCTDGGEEDLEEGEIKESSEKKESAQPARQVCRFFHRGLCFYGSACRFLHLNTFDDKKGNYSMFDQTPRVYADSYSAMGPCVGIMNQRRSVPDFVPAPPVPYAPQVESAWERGLKEAKVLLKQANKRKDEPDFEDKRLNMSLVVNEKYTPDFDKENDSSPKRERRKKSSERRDNFSSFKYHDPINNYSNDFDVYSKDSYKNFDVRYSRESEKDSRDRSKVRKSSVERFSKAGPRHRWNHSRLEEVQMRRSDHAHEFFDPWRRSKSPMGNRTSRSGSYSSVSSYSYSSRSSCSYSRSSSRSSCRSSRSPSVQQKRKQSPPAETAVSPKAGSNRFGLVKKKPGPRTSSSRSRSISRTSSRSRSISMDSVSSASTHNSTVSHSSSGSESLRQRNAHSSHRKVEPIVEQSDTMGVALSNLYPEPTTAVVKVEKVKEIANIGALDEKRDILEEKFQKPVDVVTFPSLHHLIPNFPEKVKEPVKGLHKQPIKLTLLNKNPQSKLTTLPKKDLDVIKKPEDPSKMNLLQLGVKRPLSPQAPAAFVKPAPALLPKKSASSRRDELLKQLKAVEDAIARKRAKFC